MAKLIIQRANEYGNAARKYGVYIDDQKAGTISNNDTESYDLAAGTHTLYAKIDWCYSQVLTVTLSEGETKYVRLSGIPYANLVILIYIIIVALSVLLAYYTDIDFILFTVPTFPLITLYYLTLGRRRYLTLKEQDIFS
jgi:L-asparagine transporter-like permease